MSVGPDWLQFKHAMEASRGDIIHSPKGTTWKDHKYFKKENGKYYYKDELTSSRLKAITKPARFSEDGKTHYQPTSTFELANFLNDYGVTNESDMKKIMGEIEKLYGSAAVQDKDPDKLSEAYNDIINYILYAHGSGAKFAKQIDNERKKESAKKKSANNRRY